MAPEQGQPDRRQRLHPGFYRHLLLVCLAVTLGFSLPGRMVHFSWVAFIALTLLLAWRLGPQALNAPPAGAGASPSADTLYRLLGAATAIAQIVWLFSPSSLRLSGVPLLALYTLFIAWSMARLVGALARERRIDGRLLSGATAGYLLLGISGGLCLTVIATLQPGGFRDNLTGQILTMPAIGAPVEDSSSWDLDFGRLNYFAFVSLTTVGYGDITPMTPLTRMASLCLSVLGPLYIAVVLGMLISRFTGAQDPPAPPRHGDPPPPGRSPVPTEPGRGPDG